MRYFLLSIFLSLLISGCSSVNTSAGILIPNKIVKEGDIALEVHDFESLKPLFDNSEDKGIKVINFWATWCAPCVEELPIFETLNTNYKDKGVEVTLVSLDFPGQLVSRVIPFIQKQKLKSKILFLDDPYGNKWIPQVSEDWSGAIPATVIITQDSYKFFEKSFSYRDLALEIEELLEE